jgi:dephospho-CoA kinase
VADHLRARGFAIHSLSDVVREEAARHGLAPERDHLIRIGNLLRRKEGAGTLAERICPRLGERDVVDSIRNPAEVAVLRRLPRFLLVGVNAAVELRFRRSLVRAREGDPRTLRAFVEREDRENSSDPTAQQLLATLRLADRVLSNDATLADLHAAIDRIVAEADGGTGFASG